MKVAMHNGASRRALFQLFSSSAALMISAACSANDAALALHAVPPVPPVVTPSSSALRDAGADVEATPPASSADTTYAPFDFTMAHGGPERQFSTNVPDRACTKDEECGDGFCDRGYCAGIWIKGTHYGQRCTKPYHCFGVCLEGRCRSCLSHAECNATVESKSGMVCTKRDTPLELACGVVEAHGPYDIPEPDIGPRKKPPKPATP
jgi:hypothetical protein